MMLGHEAILVYRNVPLNMPTEWLCQTLPNCYVCISQHKHMYSHRTIQYVAVQSLRTQSALPG